MERWESTPRLAFLSPEPGSGKSRALEVTELLVPRPVHAVNTTPAYLFRKVSDEAGLPTILFDEIDTVFGPRAKENEDIRGMLNAGHAHACRHALRPCQYQKDQTRGRWRPGGEVGGEPGEDRHQSGGRDPLDASDDKRPDHLAAEPHPKFGLDRQLPHRAGVRVAPGETVPKSAPPDQVESRLEAAVTDPEPQLAEGCRRPEAGGVLAPRVRRPCADGRGAEAGQPDVVGGGTDWNLGPLPVDQSGPMEPSHTVLDSALRQPGEADELAGGEHAVLTQQAE